MFVTVVSISALAILAYILVLLVAKPAAPRPKRDDLAASWHERYGKSIDRYKGLQPDGLDPVGNRQSGQEANYGTAERCHD